MRYLIPLLLPQILGALRFFAAGSYQQDVGQNYNISLSQASMSRSIHEVIDAVHSSNFFAENVKFYDTIDELNATREKYVVIQESYFHITIHINFVFQILQVLWFSWCRWLRRLHSRYDCATCKRRSVVSSAHIRKQKRISLNKCATCK